LENVEAMLEQVENMVSAFVEYRSTSLSPTDLIASPLDSQPDNVKSLLISSSSLPKFQDRESLLKDVTEQVGKAKEEVERLKPEWVDGARKRVER
jgi:hypothetical protein